MNAACSLARPRMQRLHRSPPHRRASLAFAFAFSFTRVYLFAPTSLAAVSLRPLRARGDEDHSRQRSITGRTDGRTAKRPAAARRVAELKRLEPDRFDLGRLCLAIIRRNANLRFAILPSPARRVRRGCKLLARVIDATRARHHISRHRHGERDDYRGTDVSAINASNCSRNVT